MENYTREQYIRVFKQCSFFEAFVNNFDERFAVANTVEELLEDYVINEWIDDAFRWEGTDEGYDYWEEINLHWCNFVSMTTKDAIDEMKEWYKPRKTSTKVDKSFRLVVRGNDGVRLDFTL